MENNTPLLSICIPTYNRAEYLKGAIENIVNDPGFDSRVEIVISDNASTDNTRKVVEYYTKKFNNINYYCNKENVGDKNFIMALLRAKGQYVRLFNDTLRFSSGALIHMVNVVSMSNKSSPLFFFQNNPINNKYNTNISVYDINSFLSQSSFYITWIGNFGCWRYAIDSIKNKDRFASLQLSQVDWTLQIVERAKKIDIYFNNYFSSIVPKKKGGYNIFQVFVANYLFILGNYKFNRRTIQLEKFRLMKHFVYPWLVKIKSTNNFTFDTSNSLKILFKHYALNLYFYYFIISLGLRLLTSYIVGGKTTT